MKALRSGAHPPQAREAASLRAVPVTREEGVTGPVGAILAVAIVVVLAATLWFLVHRLQTASPQDVSSGGTARFGADGYWVAPTGPQDIPVPGSRAFVTIDGVTGTVMLADLPGLAGAQAWRVGQGVCIVGPGPSCYRNSGSQVSIRVATARAIVFEVGTLADPGPAIVRDPSGAVVAQRNTTLVVRALGAQVKCGGTGAFLPVYAALSQNGGASYAPLFGGAVVNPNGGQTQTMPLLKGQSVAVRGTLSGPCGSRTLTSVPGSAFVLTLGPGDPAPNVAAFGDQASLASFLVPYVNTYTRTMVLDANQQIVFFELGSTDLSSPAADFQDLVILLTFT